MNNLNIVYIPIEQLKFAEYNPRKANKNQWEQLKRSLEKFGFVDPVIVNSASERRNIIIGGHFRVKVAKEMGIKEVPVVYVNIPDIEKEKELNLRLNKNIGEWDWDLLANFDADFLKDVGFTEKDIKKFDISNLFNTENKEDEIETDNSVFELKQSLIHFDAEGRYDIPKLREDMLYDLDISSCDIVANSKSIIDKRPYIFNWDKRVLSQKHDGIKILSFYMYDDKFERVWSDVKIVCEKIISEGWDAVISPNWSLFTDDPLALQIWSIFKTRYVSRYFQEAGIKIIPDINFSDEKSFEFCFSGLPKNIPICSYQAQNLRNEKDFKNAIKGLNEFSRLINFGKIIIYGGKKILNKLPQNILDKAIIVPTINEKIREQKNENKVKI